MAEDTNGTVEYLSLDSIIPNRNQPRKVFDKKALEELADSIDEDGLIQAIVVRKRDDDEGYELIAGERRWRAHKILNKKRIEAIVKDIDTDLSATQALVENMQREDLNAMEEAEGIKSLMDELGLNQEQAGVKLGKSRSYISNVVRLLKLPENIQEKLHENKLDKWAGLLLAGVKDADQVDKLADGMIKDGWSLETLKKKIQGAGGSKQQRKVPEKKPGPITTHLVLIECDSPKEVKTVLKTLEEDGFKCWSGKEAKEYVQGPKEEKSEKKDDKEEKRPSVRKASK